MATVNYRGDYYTTAQIDTLTPGGTIEVGDIFNVTINGKTISVVAASTTISVVVTAIHAACAASTIPEFYELAWTDSTTHITVTTKSDKHGWPFTITVTTTETGGGAADDQTFVQATTQAATSAQHWSAYNFEGGSLPGNGVTVFVPPGRTVLHNLSSLSAVTLTNLHLNGAYVGLPFWNVSQYGTYAEYRGTYLTLGVTNAYVGSLEPTGILRCKLNTGSVQTAIVVYGTGASADGNGFGAFQWKGTHASNLLEVKGGSCTVGMSVGESATIVTLLVGDGDGSTTDPDVQIGPGVTLTTTKVNAGYLETWSNITTAYVSGGEHEHQAGTLGTAHVTDGTLVYNSTGTLSSVATYELPGSIDLSRDQRPKTISAITYTVDGVTIPRVNDPNGVSTISAETPVFD